MFTSNDNLPQDLVHEALSSDVQIASAVHSVGYPQSLIEEVGAAVLKSLQGRDAGYHRGRLTGCGQISTGGGGSNIVFTGRSLIPAGWRQARVEIDPSGANNGLIWEAIAPGSEGNGIQVEYVDNGGATAVGWNGTTRTVTVGFNVGGGGDSVANVKTALAASGTGAQYVVQVRDSYGSSGAGNLTAAYTAVAMTGGLGTTTGRKVLTRAEGANKDLQFEAVDHAQNAKTITMSYVHSAGMTTLPTVAVTEGAASVAIVVTATIATHTAAQILQALRNSTSAMEWIHARLADGSSGAGTPAAFAATALTAPFGTDGFTARVGSLAANVQTLTDDGGTFDCTTGVGTAGDTVQFVLVVGGVEHQIAAAVVA